MNKSIEKVIYYVLGGIVAISFIAIIFDLNILVHETNHIIVIFALSAIIGAFIAALILQYRKNKLERENNKIRNEVITLITHEMRTGLTSTGWTIQFILDNYNDKISDNDKKILKDVINSIHAIVAHSVNLLDISVLDIKKLLISLEWFTLEKVEEMFNETIEKYKIVSQKRDIKIINNIKLDHKREVEVDMMRLRIIFETLIDNAIQYSVNDKKEINISINNDTNNMNIKVSDTGMGIPLDEQKKIFTQFFRASNARNKLISGSGIGLFMCQQYVKAHKGKISFESKENEGTTFSIIIPLKTIENVNEFLEKI